MKIKGLQELTLIDYPGKIACTLFLYGCNFRCGFCHNPELVLSSVGKDYNEKEILDFLKKRKGQLEGICITGGEPLMTIEVDFLKKIKDLGYSIKLDTNGSFPELLEELIKKGLIDFVAMDIKSSKEKYQKITNSNIDVKKIEKSIKVISSLLDYYEFRTTILEDFHDVKELEDMAKWLNQLCAGKPKKFVLQGFKNQGKFIDESFKNKKSTKEEYLSELKNILKDYFEIIEVRV
ncbi:anaerobic ribonucleoside-triphosphate reductase activating protein [Candidatus Pacearchaeota archaeon]|nr:MAG: anaerobic ribonucleoside-triphosphate reductase activating protein [Candidatus Pacearchaeota archaeon]